jgi:GT2 family glycosyltransferase
MNKTEHAEVELRGFDRHPLDGDAKSAAAPTDFELLQKQVAALAAQVKLLQDYVAEVRQARPDVDRGLLEYDWFVQRFRRWLADILPSDARVLVATRGDHALLGIPDRHAGHFPQDDRAGYAGFYPADDTAAIGHLEALRHEGYDTLVFPEPAAWWLEHYTGLRQHLESNYVETAGHLPCRLFDLRPRADRPPFDDMRLDRVFAQARRSLGREPDVLDWVTGAKLRERFPTLAIAEFSGNALPHIDHSIDIVAIPDDKPSSMREARRVAAWVVVVIADGLVVKTESVAASRPTPSASQVTVMHVQEPLGSGRIVTNRMTVDEDSSEDVLVWMSSGVVAVPGAMAPLLATLQRFPQAGVVGGRILEFSGRLYHAGGAMGVDASLRSRGEGNSSPDDPRYAFVQTVDYCSSLFMATTRGAFEAAGGFDSAIPYGPLRDADFCLRVQDHGYSIYYQPESVAVCSAALSRALRASAGGPDLRRQRREFAARWKTVLQSRMPRGDVWGT